MTIFLGHRRVASGIVGCRIPEQGRHKSQEYCYDPDGEPGAPPLDEDVKRTLVPFLEFAGSPSVGERLTHERYAPGSRPDAA